MNEIFMIFALILNLIVIFLSISVLIMFYSHEKYFIIALMILVISTVVFVVSIYEGDDYTNKNSYKCPICETKYSENVKYKYCPYDGNILISNNS